MAPLHFGGSVLAICVAVWAILSTLLGQDCCQTQLVLDLERTSREEGEWDLNVSSSENSTGHLIFQSVSSLLQHWSNARHRNGHTIVPGTIPIGTTLYHGRSDSNYPNGSDWLATDPEHSFLFCKRPCWHLTVVTTRPLKVLYFDGSSAVKMHGGSMDSQDMLLWGERKAEKVFKEEERLEELCRWGKEYGLDGFVRMEMDFEVMLCDFSYGVETVSFLHLANASPDNPLPPRDGVEDIDDADSDPDSLNDLWTGHGLNPAVTIRNFELMHSSLQYNQFPGDTRIQLDLTRLVSFFDPDLAPSLVRARNDPSVLGRRWLYDLARMDSEDVDIFHRKLREVLLGTTTDLRGATGVDWQTLFQVVIKRFGSRLETLRYVLGASIDDSTIMNEEDRVLKAFAQVNVMLTPYIPYGLKSSGSKEDSEPALAWASPVYKMCSTTHTSYIVSRLSERMTPSERLLLGAVQDTTKGICRVLVKIWAEGVELGLDSRYWVRKRAAQVDADLELEALAKTWLETLKDLMDWLDWHMWVRCNPACGDEEICYMPTWPFFGGPPPGPAEGPASVEHPSESGNEWERPMPKCIRKIAPYSF